MWEIYTYGGGDFLRLIFNGVAQIFGDSDYIVALKSAALIGLMGVLFMAAFKRGRLDLQWILAVIMLYLIAIVPKTHVIINDRVIPANSAVVENIPFGISATASIFSKLSDWITRSFETVFSLPNQVKYTGNGLMFAQTLVEESTRFEITTPRVSTNFSEFWKSCVYYDLLLGLYSWNDLLRTTDLNEFLSKKTSQTRAFTYEQEKGEREILTCRSGFNEVLQKDLEQEIGNSTNIQGSRLIPNESNKNEAISRFASAMPVAYQYLTGLSLSNSKIISQNILSNSFKRGLMSFASDADATAAAEDFALSKSEAEKRTTFSVMGKLAKKMLPIMHHIFESFIYAIFPIVMLMAMLPSAGQVLSRYFMALFWINLWPPLYCLLHFAASFYGQKAASAAVIQAGEGFATGLSVMTNTGLGNILSDYAAITGYLSMSIPMISWLIISASGAMMAGLAGRVMEDYDKSVSSAAAEATSGNMNLGNFHYQNHSAFQSHLSPQSDSGSMMIQGDDGIRRTITSSGSYLSAPASSIPLSINLGEAAISAIKNSHTEATSFEKTTMMENLSSNAKLESVKKGTVDLIHESKGYSQNLSQSDHHFLSHSHEKTQGIIDQFAKNEGMSSRAAWTTRKAIEAQAGLGGNFGIAVLGEKINGQISDGREKVSHKSIEKMMQLMTSQRYNEAQREEAGTAKNILAKMDSSQTQSQDMALSNAINQQEQISFRHHDSQRQLEQISEQRENVEQISASISQTGTDGLINWITTKKGIPEEDVRSLITNYNLGVPEAKKNFHDLASEYIRDYVQSHSQNTAPQHIPSQSDIFEKYQSSNRHFNEENDLSGELKWKDEGKYNQLEQSVEKIFKDPDLLKDNFSDHLRPKREELENKGNEMKEEYNHRQKEDEENQNKFFIKRLTDNAGKRLKEFIDGNKKE